MMPVRRKSFIFFMLDEAEVRCVPQREYIKLLGGALHMPEHANKAVRVADWYVELQDVPRNFPHPVRRCTPWRALRLGLRYARIGAARNNRWACWKSFPS